MQRNHSLLRFLKWTLPVLLVVYAMYRVRYIYLTSSFSGLTELSQAKAITRHPLKINIKAWDFEDNQSLKTTPYKWLHEYPRVRCPQLALPEDTVHHPELNNLNASITWAKLTQVTDPRRTTVQLMESEKELRVCDQIHVRIEARDILGNTKPYGGDFIRVKLGSNETRSYVNPDYVIDRRNGSYDAYFTLRWPGTTHIDAMLVHASEAVNVINRLVQKIPNRLAYYGVYQHPETQDKEDTRCDINVPKEKYCNYSDSRVLTPWYCVKPTNPVLTCRHLQETCPDDEIARERLTQYTSSYERELFQRMKTPIGETCVSFQVAEDTVPSKSRLPFCKLPEIPSVMSSGGYFYNDTWFPFDCDIKSFSAEETLACLKDTHIYMYGDSTIRQFLDYFLTHLEGFKTTLRTKDLKLGPHDEYNEVYNVTLKFRCHGLPVRIGQTRCIFPEDVHYVSNELNELQGGPNVIVLISLWAHLQKTSLYLYEKRIEGILDSVQRLLERSPQTTVIFKGANTRFVPDFFWAVCSSDWVAYLYEMTLRRALSKRNLNVGFLDAWDLTNAHYSLDHIHPNDHLVGTMINHVLTHYCKL